MKMKGKLLTTQFDPRFLSRIVLINHFPPFSGLSVMKPLINLSRAVLLLSSFVILAPILALADSKIVTYSFNGVMQGNSIFPEGTPFIGSFSYEHPQEQNADGAYMLQNYDLTFLAGPLPVGVVYDGFYDLLAVEPTFYGTIIPADPFTTATWNGAFVDNVYPSISISNFSTDSFSVVIDRNYIDIGRPGLVRLSGPVFVLTDSTGRIFEDSSLPDLSNGGGIFTGGQISIGFDIDSGSSATQTGVITFVVPESSTCALVIIAGGCALCWAGRRRPVQIKSAQT
jgi:hypothetical protein